MNTYLLCSIVFLFCAAMNMFNAWRTSNGFSLVLGFVWLIASILLFLVYRRSTQKKDDKPEGEETE